MSGRHAPGRGLFYTRDSVGHSELAPPQYVVWAQAEARKLNVAFAGTPEAIETMMAHGISAEGDLYLDYGVSGNVLNRAGFDAFCRRALADQTVSHLFVPRRDRIARPDNPLDAMSIEYELRSAGLTLVLMDQILPPLFRGQRIDLADLLTSMIAYDTSGKFRRELAEKLIHAKIRLAEQGFSIGGEPIYGFRRWLCDADGRSKRELQPGEVVKMAGHHVLWLPTAERELEVVRRILDLIESTPAARIARMLNSEGVLSPMAGRSRKVRGVAVPFSGLWTSNTIRNIASHPLLNAICEFGRRAMGDQLRLTPNGPRALSDGDYRSDGRPKAVTNPTGATIRSPGQFEPLISSEKHASILQVLKDRGKHLKGKARTRGDSPNPLGGRIYDLNCGWLMYRHARRGRWGYQCGLYQNSQAKSCAHNVVPGEVTTHFVLACLRQRVLASTALAKLKERLHQFAKAEGSDDPARRRRESCEVEVAAIERKIVTVGRNMALAATPEEREITAGVFHELRAEADRLQKQLEGLGPTPAECDPEREVAAALSGLDRLHELADLTGSGTAAVGELFRKVDAKLYLRFRVVEDGCRTLSVPSGGVLTFGSTPPPGPLYEGPTDRAIIRQKLDAGESVSASPGLVALGVSESGPEVHWSAIDRQVSNARRPSRIEPVFYRIPPKTVGFSIRSVHYLPDDQ